MWSDIILSTLTSPTEGDLRWFWMYTCICIYYMYIDMYIHMHFLKIVTQQQFFPQKGRSSGSKCFGAVLGGCVWQCLISPALKVINVIPLFYHEYEWRSEGWMQPKNLREKWGMNHFWKYISPKSVLLHILYPFQYATKGLSHQLECCQKRTNESEDTKINAGSQVTPRCSLWLVQ